jgi:hypothetical protein
MADEPLPTYRVETQDGVTRYVCLVPDAGHEDGICGHWATDLDLFTQHQHHRHAGQMVAEPAPASVKAGHASARESKASVAEKADAKAPAMEKAESKA